MNNETLKDEINYEFTKLDFSSKLVQVSNGSFDVTNKKVDYTDNFRTYSVDDEGRWW